MLSDSISPHVANFKNFPGGMPPPLLAIICSACYLCYAQSSDLPDQCCVAKPVSTTHAQNGPPNL